MIFRERRPFVRMNRDSRRTTSSPSQSSGEGMTNVLIVLVIVVPIIFTLIVCAVTYFIFRHNRRQTNNMRRYAPRNAANPAVATIIYNSQHNPFTIEDLPPSYESLTQIKDQSPIDSSTNSNQAAAVNRISSGNATPPPLYIDLVNRKQ